MFGWFSRRLPLSTFSRVDIELLLRRTIDVVGSDRVRGASIVTDLNSLGLDQSSPDSLVQSATQAVTRLMPNDTQPIRVAIVTNADFDMTTRYTGAARQDTPARLDTTARLDIRAEATSDPLVVTMEIAYGLATHYWTGLASGRPMDESPRTTTLLPVALGLGVLAADASLAETHWSASGFSGWSMSRCGYYSAIEIGYAMALLARMRGETNPAWMRSLRLDARTTMRQSTQWFAKTEAAGGSLLFDAVRIPGSDRDTNELAQWLDGDDACFAMASAYALAKRDRLPDAAIDAALRRTEGKDPELVVLATRLLGSADPTDARVTAGIKKLAASSSPSIALAALQAASHRGMAVEPWTARIIGLLGHPQMDLIPLVELIDRHPRELSAVAPAVVQELMAASGYGDEEAADALARCLIRISDDPVAVVESAVGVADTDRSLVGRIERLRLEN